MCNLNEIQQYDDEIDQWAARREFELRDEAWAREWRLENGAGSTVDAFKLMAKAARALSRSFGEFRCEDPERAWIEMLREETT